MVQVRRTGFDLGLCVGAYVGCVVMVNRRHIKCGFCAKSIYLQTYLMTRDFFPLLKSLFAERTGFQRLAVEALFAAVIRTQFYDKFRVYPPQTV